MEEVNESQFRKVTLIEKASPLEKEVSERFLMTLVWEEEIPNKNLHSDLLIICRSSLQ